VTLETPQDFVQWQAEGELKEQARQAKSAARVARKPPQRGGPPAAQS
jgi:hypothetical protein